MIPGQLLFHIHLSSVALGIRLGLAIVILLGGKSPVPHKGTPHCLAGHRYSTDPVWSPKNDYVRR